MLFGQSLLGYMYMAIQVLVRCTRKYFIATFIIVKEVRRVLSEVKSALYQILLTKCYNNSFKSE